MSCTLTLCQGNEKVTKKRRVANVLEQGGLGEEAGGEYEVLDKEVLQRLRDRYEDKLGGPPSEFERPTDDQLSALKDRLVLGCHRTPIFGLRTVW